MQRLFLTLGTILVLTGLGCFFYLGSLVMQFFNAPASNPLLLYISEKLNVDNQSFSGTMDGKDFTIAIPDSMLAIAHIAIGIMAAGLMIALVQALIVNGISLLKAATKVPAPTDAPTSRHIT